MMLGRSKTKSNSRQGPEDQSHEPLLGDDEREAEVVFALDDDDEESSIRQEGSSGGRAPEARAIAPSLRSTVQSREAEFELDSDVLDNDDVPHTSHNLDQRMPLLVGLADASAVRRNPDLPLHTLSNGATGGGMINGRVVYDDDDPDSRVDLAELAARQHAGGNLLDSMFNMANSILGAGLDGQSLLLVGLLWGLASPRQGLPYAVSQAGFFTGMVLLVVLAGVTDWTIRLIVRNAKLSGRTSYIDIMGHCFGSSGRAAVSFFQFAFAFGGMCAFGIIIGDTIPHVIRQLFPSLSTTPVLSILTHRKFIVILCTTCISYPLSLYRSIASLARASTFALIGMLIIVTTVLFEESRVAPELKGSQASSVKFSLIQPQIFQAIGVISFAFVCHHNSLLIYGSLRTPTMDRFDRVTHVAAGVSLVACLTLAIPAFLVFTNKTQGNVLNNFPQGDTVINIARFCFGANMVTTTPMELMVCREVIEEYFFAHEAFDQTRHVLFTTSILFASMVGVMLEITGGASATALAFVFPALCYIKLLPAHEPWHSRVKLPAVLCAGFGLVVLVLSVGLALGKTWGPEGSTRSLQWDLSSSRYWQLARATRVGGVRCWSPPLMTAPSASSSTSQTPPSPPRSLKGAGVSVPRIHLGSFSPYASPQMSRRTSPPRADSQLRVVPEMYFLPEDLADDFAPRDSRYPVPAARPPPVQPVIAAIEEVCVECMMRDRDMADVDVTSPGIWARESDVWYEELVRREEDEARSGVPPDPIRRRTPAHGMMLTTANLRIWTQMHPKEPQARWITLTDFVRKQAALLEAEQHARAQAARESRLLDNRLRDTYHALRRSAYDLNDGPVRIRAPTNPEELGFLASPDQSRDVTLLASGMIQERVDLRKEERERRRSAKRHGRKNSRQSKSSGGNIDTTSIYSSPSPPPDLGSRMGAMGRSQPALTTPASPVSRRLSTPLTPPLAPAGARPSIHTRSSQSSFESRAGKKGFLSFKHWSGFGSEASFGPPGTNGPYRGSVYDSVADMHLVLDQEKQAHRMPYDQMSLAPSVATGADGTIHADQRSIHEKKKKAKGLTKIWKIVTGTATKEKHAAMQEKHQVDDEPLAPPPPLSYLVGRQGGERAGGGPVRDLDRRASTPTSSGRSAAPMSPATAPSSILPSPTSQRFPWRDSGSDEERREKNGIKDNASYLEVPSSMSGMTLSPKSQTLSVNSFQGRRSVSAGMGTFGGRPGSIVNTNKSLPPLPSEAFARGNRPQMDARPQTLAAYGLRRSDMSNGYNGMEALVAPQPAFRNEGRRQSFGGLTARPDLYAPDGSPLLPPPRIGARYDEFGGSRRSLGSLDRAGLGPGKADSLKRGSVGRRLASFLTGGHKKKTEWDAHMSNGEQYYYGDMPHPTHRNGYSLRDQEASSMSELGGSDPDPALQTPTAGYARSTVIGVTGSGKRLDVVPVDDFVAIRYPSAECQSLDLLRR
ncbi:hypothetical protein FRC10_002221 [Ceratobasidium sp. 414]|nr:hypothetical protein FRC10_002221 [Ceratobasidium sp. 414]